MAIDEIKTQEIKKLIEEKLKEKSRNLICPICGNGNFVMADGYTQDGLQDQLTNVVLGGRSIPVVIVVCAHCGHVLRFSLGVLGLLSKQEEKAGGKDDKK